MTQHLFSQTAYFTCPIFFFAIYLSCCLFWFNKFDFYLCYYRYFFLLEFESNLRGNCSQSYYSGSILIVSIWEFPSFLIDIQGTYFSRILPSVIFIAVWVRIKEYYITSLHYISGLLNDKCARNTLFVLFMLIAVKYQIDNLLEEKGLNRYRYECHYSS